MNIPSGYQVLNLKKAPFAAGATSHTVKGAFQAVAGANGKPLIVANCQYGDELFASMHAWYQVENDGVTISTDSGYSFSITSADVVTIVAPAGG